MGSKGRAILGLLRSLAPQSTSVLTGPALGCAGWRCVASAAAASPATNLRGCGIVPLGHTDSDLSPTVCHIGLGRRRDLMLRQDLFLYTPELEKKSLADLFKGKRVMVVGFPGGRICTEQHIPGYVAMTDALIRKGVDAVLCITPDQPEAVQALLAAKPNLTNSKVKLVADPNGGFIRLLGLELGAAASQAGPKCQRFAGIVDNGVLLKVKVETSPASLKETDAESMCTLWECVYGLQTK